MAGSYGDIDRGRAPEPSAVLGRQLLLRDLLHAYWELRSDTRPNSDSSNEHYMLEHLSAGLGDRDATRLTPQDLVNYCSMGKEEGAGPYTCQHGGEQARHRDALRQHGTKGCGTPTW